MSTYGPYWSTVGIRQIRKDNAAVEAAPILNITGGAVVTYVPASALNPIPRIDVALPADPTAAVAALQAADVTLDGRLDAVEPYAIAGGRWDMPDVVTTDAEAGHGQCVRVDMTGKVSPDVVTITLPASTVPAKGRPICIMTVNAGGAAGGSKLRIETTGGQLITSGLGTFIEGTGEIRFTIVDNGNGWDIQSSP